MRTWLIVGGGEPMVRADTVMRMIERIRRHGMNGSLQSNGTHFRPAHFEPLISAGWQNVIVSLDGPDSAINDSVRSAGSFEKATAAMRLLTEMKRGRGAALPRLSLNVTLTRPLAALEARPSLPFNTNLGAFMAGGGKPTGMTAADFRESDGTLERAACYEPWLSLAVLPDGRTGPCCAMWAPDAESLADRSFDEVWRGVYLQGVRAQICEGKPPVYCRNCPSILGEQVREQRRLYRERAEWREAGTAGRAFFLARKALRSAKARGLKGIIRRGIEWAIPGTANSESSGSPGRAGETIRADRDSRSRPTRQQGWRRRSRPQRPRRRLEAKRDEREWLLFQARLVSGGLERSRSSARKGPTSAKSAFGDVGGNGEGLRRF